MASSRTVASTAPTTNPYSDSEFLEDSSSSDMSRRTISELSKVPRLGQMDSTEDVTEERMKVLLQEQFERKKQLTLTAMNKAFVKSINAYSLVLVLLATVTYAGFLQPPGSFDGDGFMRTYENSSLTWFVYFNSLSFYFSMADLILCLSGNFAPLADLHTETFLANPKPNKLKKKRSNHVSFRIRFLNDFVDRITQGPDAPCPSIETVAEHDRVPDSVFLEQAITHRLAHFVAYTLTKAATINLLFVISLTCCVAAFAAAGNAVTSRPHQSQVPVIVTSVIGCFTYLCFMLWLLTDSIKFFWRAGYSLGAVATSLADALAQNAGHLETQLQYCGGNMDNATAVPEAAAADHPALAPILDSRGTFERRVGPRDRRSSSN
ncbi:hypothetical protein M758_10G120000 [Ceratodon purpureus]|uniref:PGG domain-containing protein n=1 Tax=Ceratodon purpureus TaxID=3225 RepID=A0A8T0GL37_CERPU|nr:hypothetical protein KC19_10G124400 [Ceratodon purpureus]KAG0603777.1 hypothetical protein M758_10G120000 [Ceratodon purpureus]